MNDYIKVHSLWLDKALQSKFDITVSEPVKEGTYLQNYITYLISTLPGGWSVRRRYSDIEYLLNGLVQRYPAMLFEAMPPKKIVNNTDIEFVEIRMKGLEHFLNKLAENPYLQRDNLFLDFLQLPQTEWNEFRHKNGKIVQLDIGEVSKSKSFFSGFSNILKKIPKDIEDKRINEGLIIWHKYLTHLPTPENVDVKIREFKEKVDESITILESNVEILKGIVVAGTNYSLMGDKLYDGLLQYSNNNKKMDFPSLKVKQDTVDNHKRFNNYLQNFTNAINGWKQLEFFSPQEIVPEMQYELEDELEHLKGVKDLLDRRIIYTVL